MAAVIQGELTQESIEILRNPKTAASALGTNIGTQIGDAMQAINNVPAKTQPVGTNLPNIRLKAINPRIGKTTAAKIEPK